jgi:hypothetical protein
MKKIFFILLVFGLCQKVKGESNPSLISEYHALMDLYAATNKSGWLNETGWKNTNPNVVQSVEGWYGIEVDDIGHVVKLDLSANNLSGTIPASIAALNYMTSLILNNNKLSDVIPLSFSKLTKLTALHLENNTFTGPVDFVSNLTKLKDLYLNDNAFYGNIPALANLRSLQSIYAQNNKFEKLPADILTLPLLKMAQFSNNVLAAVPDFSSQMNKANLTLDLGKNALSFSQLMPLASAGIQSLNYQPQSKIDEIKNVRVENGSLSLTTTIDRTTTPASVYQWFKVVNGNPSAISSAAETNYSFSILQVTPDDVGVQYYYTITNPAVPGLKLISQLQTSVEHVFCLNINCFDNGSVGINTQLVPSGYRLALKGKMIMTGAKIALNRTWPDYVFGKDYKFLSLPDLHDYIVLNKHLPNVPSANDVKSNGIDLEDMSVKLLEKTEELSLYFIQLDERLKKLEE